MAAEHEGRIDYIEFPAADLEPIKAFYTGLFGWRFTDYGPDYTSFEDGRLTGGFYRADEAGANSPLAVIYTAKLEETKARVEQAGGRILRDIFSFPGGRRFHFADPSGNELAIWSDR